MQTVRDIPIQSRSVAGKIFSYKNNKLISYESQLELAFIYHLEFTPNVKSYIEQPIKVYYKTGKRKIFFIPDFIVYYSDFHIKPLIVEIKYSQELQERKNYVKRKISILKSYADENNMNFRLITEKELLGNKLENYKFLYGYIPEPTHIIEFVELKQLIIDFVKEKIRTTPKEVIDTLGESLEEKAKLLTLVWHLLANNILTTDLNKPLTNNSLIGLNLSDTKNYNAVLFMINTI